MKFLETLKKYLPQLMDLIHDAEKLFTEPSSGNQKKEWVINQIMGLLGDKLPWYLPKSLVKAILGVVVDAVVLGFNKYFSKGWSKYVQPSISKM